MTSIPDVKEVFVKKLNFLLAVGFLVLLPGLVLGSPLEDGKQFLATNAKKDQVVILPSGLQYEVLTKGTGKTPGATNSVSVHYKGMLIDGTEFDSSYKRGKPATFPVNRVIKGWTEALQLMSEGSKWMLYIPQDLAYGKYGAGAEIPPYSTLIFEVELLKVLPY